MTVDECITTYLHTMGKVFEKKCGQDIKRAISGALYSAQTLESETKRLIREKRKDGNENAKLSENENPCKVYRALSESVRISAHTAS